MHGVEVDMTIWWVAYVTPPLKIPGYTPDKIIQKAFILAAVMMNSTQTSEYSDIIIFFVYLFIYKKNYNNKYIDCSFKYSKQFSTFAASWK